MIEIIHEDVLSVRADALILAIDGARRGLEGDIARAFARRWPDAWTEIEDSIRYPLPLGKSAVVTLESESGFPVVLIVSTLHHLDILDAQQKLQVIRSALLDAVRLGRNKGVTSLATAVLTGGWRLDFSEALGAMYDTLRYTEAVADFLVRICLFSQKDLDVALALANERNIAVIHE